MRVKAIITSIQQSPEAILLDIKKQYKIKKP